MNLQAKKAPTADETIASLLSSGSKQSIKSEVSEDQRSTVGDYAHMEPRKKGVYLTDVSDLFQF